MLRELSICSPRAGEMRAKCGQGTGEWQSRCGRWAVRLPAARCRHAAQSRSGCSRAIGQRHVSGSELPPDAGSRLLGRTSSCRTVQRLPQGGAQRGWWSLAAGSMLSRNRRHWRILDPGKRSELTVAPDSLTHRESTAPARARTGACARGRTAGGGFGAPDFAVIIAPVFDRHFLPVAAVTWIIASGTAAGAAFRASSLLAGAAVVTTRLAQGCCHLARKPLPQGSHWLAQLRGLGAMLPRVGRTRHAWRRTLLIETGGAAGTAKACISHRASNRGFSKATIRLAN